jgi:K+-sensing histidine kinase KdpD
MKLEISKPSDNEDKGYIQPVLMKEKMLSYLLHDIRTPLKYIHRLTESLSKHYEGMNPVQLKETLNEICESTSQFSLFTENFLHWLNMQSGSFQIKKVPVNLNRTVQKSIDLFGSIAHHKRVNIYNNISTELELSTDATILEIVIRNLIDNALKHSQAGSIVISCTCNSNPTIVITDSGIGMSEQTLFNLWQSIAARNKSTNGGLGLLIVSEMTQVIGARLFIESKPNKGTSITITFNN